jgi:uncharacterized protein YqfA (UPF0365 family)
MLHETTFNNPQDQWHHEGKQGIQHEPVNYEVWDELRLEDPEVGFQLVEESMGLSTSLEIQSLDIDLEIRRDLLRHLLEVDTMRDEADIEILRAEGDKRRQQEIKERVDADVEHCRDQYYEHEMGLRRKMWDIRAP